MQEENLANVKKRLKWIVRYKKLKDIQGLAAYLEVTRDRLYTWIKRDVIADPEIVLGKMPEIQRRWLLMGEGEPLLPGDPEEGRELATTKPGDKNDKRVLQEESKRITYTDRSLRALVEWMDDYFGKDPDQILPFIIDLTDEYPSFKAYLQKKPTGEDMAPGPPPKVSNLDK
ncbi:MAG: helix-turn-helix domain containing protein [Desulfobulbus sp.]|jgi:hypothetical protein|uniref:helix-turn-helix domain-containing protein n=1 Tax=Desulfobulbus sp. TaxID=895 RepID=UPI00283AFBE8|nr:helix-turn-helix domain-containing protein [Desulfobulbus sp.]MDR2549385.1 helix-turn-helix domain containing protein [Desulfobulbus sp.]